MVSASSFNDLLRLHGVKWDHEDGTTDHPGLVIGKGGVGCVYRMVRKGLPITMKVVSLRTTRDDVRTMKLEAHITGLLARRGICPRVYFFDLVGDVAIIGMQLLEKTLYTALCGQDRCTLTWAKDYIRLIRRTARLGVVATDLKPTNVMYDAADRMYLIDMGYTIHHSDPVFRRKRLELSCRDYRHMLVVFMLSMFVLNSVTFYAHLDDRGAFRSIIEYIRSYDRELRAHVRDCLLQNCVVTRLLFAYLPTTAAEAINPIQYAERLLNRPGGPSWRVVVPHMSETTTVLCCGEPDCDPVDHLGHHVHGDEAGASSLPLEWYQLVGAAE